jgi:hypothetical protein
MTMATLAESASLFLSDSFLNMFIHTPYFCSIYEQSLIVIPNSNNAGFRGCVSTKKAIS